MPNPTMRPLSQVHTLIIHHSAGERGSVEEFRAEHKAKGWADIGYHAVIGNGHGQGNGVLEQGRSEMFEGAGVFGNNANKLHVCLVGNFENHPPTAEQLDTLGKWLVNRLHLHPHAGIEGHNEAAIPEHGTLCPGLWMRERLGDIRGWAHRAHQGLTQETLADALLNRKSSVSSGEHAVLSSAQNHGQPQTAAPAGHTPTPSHTPIKVSIHVKGYMDDNVKSIISAAGAMIEGQPFVALSDLVQGLGWSDPVHDIVTDLLTVETKKGVRTAQTPQQLQDALDRRADGLK